MKLSKETQTIIKNFASINTNLLFKPGNVLTTVSGSRTVFATTPVKEDFPIEFGIYDLNEFLAVCSVFNDPEFEFNEKYLTIKEGRNSIKFYASEASNLIVANKTVAFPESYIDFVLPSDSLSAMLRAAAILKVVDVSVIGDGSRMYISVGNKKATTANNTYELELGETDKVFTVNFNIDKFKMLPGTYNVSISQKRVSRFQNGDLIYYIAIEADSTI